MDTFSLTQSLLTEKTPEEALDYLEQIATNNVESLGFSIKKQHLPSDTAGRCLIASWGKGKNHLIYVAHLATLKSEEEQLDSKASLSTFLSSFQAVMKKIDANNARLSLLLTFGKCKISPEHIKPIIDGLFVDDSRPTACLIGEPTRDRRLGETVTIGRRGSLNAHLVVHGRKGHVAYPFIADNPIPRLLRTLIMLQYTPLDNGAPYFQPSRIEITSIDVNNPALSTIPEQATARFNIRFNSLHTAESLAQAINLISTEYAGLHEITFDCPYESYLTTPCPYIEMLSQAVESVTHSEPHLSTVGTYSYGQFFVEHCPTAEFGISLSVVSLFEDSSALRDALNRTESIYLNFMENFFRVASSTE